MNVWVMTDGCDDCGFGEPILAFPSEQAAWDGVAAHMAEHYAKNYGGETWFDPYHRADDRRLGSLRYVRKRKPQWEWFQQYVVLYAITEVPLSNEGVAHG